VRGLRNFLICLLFLLSSFSVFAAKVNISDFLEKNKETSWTTPSEEFIKKNGSKHIYRWNSKQNKSLHYAANRTKKALYFLDWSVTEADFNFDNKQLNSMSLNIYNKTCATNKQLAVNKNTFLKFVKKIQASLNTFYKAQHSKPSIKLINSARCYSCVWDTPNAYVVLKWSYDGANRYNFVAHYATVYIYKNKQDFNEKNNSKAAPLSLAELKSNIKINKDGDRYLEIPMVDQGQRGYCVVACAERILKYYKVNMDQHILAQVANTSSGGTRTTDIESSMKKVGVKCNFRVKELSEYSPLVGSSKILSFIKKYNRHAKKARKSKIDVKRVRGYNHLFRLMDEELLVKTKIDYDKSGFRKFQMRIKENIDKGMPVLWGVMLGMVKEAKIPQNMGGHMRLIIGYNPKTKEMIYTDTWGRGHEFKKISWGKAWAMTSMAYVFIPKK
jgi:Peptidase C39 family